MMQDLSRPQAFAQVESGLRAPAEIVQTHASGVLLTPKHAYKLKKPEDLGFLDYSTPQLRRHFCQLEVRLNTHLASDIYLGVAAVIRLVDGGVRFTRIYRVDVEDVPLLGDTVDGGVVIDYAVVMMRVQEEATLDALLRSGRLTPELVAVVACFVAAFHGSAHTDEQISRFGTLAVVRANWEENFAQMRPYVGRTLTPATDLRITRYIRAFMERRADLFRTRVRAGRIRDCHGDLRLQHVYRLGKSNSRPRLAILDCIEFNERFRCGDVASEIAFLAMELNAAGRADLARTFIQAYVAASGDAALQEVLPFYLCYRACVRGKVASFLLDQPEVADAEREAAARQAATFFELAAQYASGPTRPVLMLVGGVMGTGKSTIAAALHTALGWPILSSDVARKRLAGLDLTTPQDTP
ncbi:MAG TPA: AAA family ATPase, partial [Ktedonobacterales bacterium]|nr:AAA family ATPase [Ktedonobacterales bacterium]